jgi:thymidine phosphorylase
MNQPNGRLAGNGVEVDEALETLSGRGPADLRELSLALAAEILVASSAIPSADEARKALAGHLDSGRALAKFREMVRTQGGDLDAPRHRAPVTNILAKNNGFVTAINVEQLGLAIIEMGGGRKKMVDQVDHSVGLEMLVRLGDRVERGQPLVRVFARPDKRDLPVRMVDAAFQIGSQRPESIPLIAERIVPQKDGFD